MDPWDLLFDSTLSADVRSNVAALRFPFGRPPACVFLGRPCDLIIGESKCWAYSNNRLNWVALNISKSAESWWIICAVTNLTWWPSNGKHHLFFPGGYVQGPPCSANRSARANWHLSRQHHSKSLEPLTRIGLREDEKQISIRIKFRSKQLPSAFTFCPPPYCCWSALNAWSQGRYSQAQCCCLCQVSLLMQLQKIDLPWRTVIKQKRSKEKYGWPCLQGANYHGVRGFLDYDYEPLVKSVQSSTQIFSSKVCQIKVP